MTNGGIVAHSIDHSRTADVTERSRARAAAGTDMDGRQSAGNATTK